MNEEQELTKTKNQSHVFTRRLDFYWKSISFYILAVILYSILKGSIAGYQLTIVFSDPIVLLLVLFIIGSTIAQLINIYKNKIIIIDKDFITLHSRFNQKTYSIKEIKRISFAQKKFYQFNKRMTVAKIFITNRKRAIRIRPSSYWNQKELLQSILSLKKRLNKSDTFV
jgi:hypothetical protein